MKPLKTQLTREGVLGYELYLGRLPDRLIPDESDFERLWNLHPMDFHRIPRGGYKPVPRWSEAYECHYIYSRTVHRAVVAPPELEPYQEWIAELGKPLNGILVNWYDSARGHYIGAHRDSEVNRVKGTPILTVSLGQERVFRIRPLGRREAFDLPMPSGTVVLMPWETNENVTHEVPKLGKREGQRRRISLTFRSFDLPIECDECGELQVYFCPGRCKRYVCHNPSCKDRAAVPDEDAMDGGRCSRCTNQLLLDLYHARPF